MLRSRPVQRADRAAVAELIQRGRILEPIQAGLERLFELDGRIVASSACRVETIAPPTYLPEPIGRLDEPFQPGTHRALIGTGLVVHPLIERSTWTMVHRLARTLASQEEGARYCVVITPLPQTPPIDAGVIVQQIAAGDLHDPAAAIPISEGYWPIGTIDHAAVMVLRNDAF